MQQGNFINVFLARHVSSTYAHHQEHWMLSFSVWFSAPSFWLGGGLESYCVGRVCGADGALRLTTTHPKTRCRKPYAATQHPVLLMMGVCTRNMSSYEYVNKITLLHQAGISDYFMRKMHGQATLKKLHNLGSVTNTVSCHGGVFWSSVYSGCVWPAERFLKFCRSCSR